jgi:ATP/ADP translocase
MLTASRTHNSACSGPDYAHRQRCSQITTVDEAKQFYPLFGLGANVALIFSGRAVVAFSKVGPASSAVWQAG